MKETKKQHAIRHIKQLEKLIVQYPERTFYHKSLRRYKEQLEEINNKK